MTLAVYGKHPAKGDFLEHGLPEALKPALEAWLDLVMAEARSTLGADWDMVWPTAPMLRFWIGEAIWGGPVAGVMAASHDRVGRRFPLVFLSLGGLPPPVIDPDQRWYDAVCAHLCAQAAVADLASPAALLLGAPKPEDAGSAAGTHDFWAVRPGPLVAELLTDIALTDHRRAAESRSYWWVAGSPEPDVGAELATSPATGLPKPEAEAVSEVTAAAGAELETATEQVPDVAASSIPEVAIWAAPALESETGGDAASPFDFPAGGYGLFQPPEQGEIAVPIAVPIAVDRVAAVASARARRQTWSQLWVGQGLPSGEVMAWLLRGYAVDA